MKRFTAFLLSGLIVFGVAEAKPRKKPAAHKKARTQTALNLTADAINQPQQGEIGQDAHGSAVVRSQILLQRAHFSCGAIDGEFGSNLQKAVAAYQQDRNLPVTAKVDAATWNSLNADQAPPLMSYTITAEDVKGPFVPIPADMMKRAALPAMGYSSPLEGLAEKFHASPQLLQELNRGADFTHVGQPLQVPNVMTMPPGEASSVVVSKSESSVRALGNDGKLLAFYVATIGSEHDPLPIGDWKIKGVRKNPDFHYNPELFWDARKADGKTEIKPGPNNPVGLVWIDLSKEHYGIHGTPEPSQVGHATSHGCIRLTNWDALELAFMVKPGTPATLKE